MMGLEESRRIRKLICYQRCDGDSRCSKLPNTIVVAGPAVSTFCPDHAKDES